MGVDPEERESFREGKAARTARDGQANGGQCPMGRERMRKPRKWPVIAFGCLTSWIWIGIRRIRYVRTRRGDETEGGA